MSNSNSGCGAAEPAAPGSNSNSISHSSPIVSLSSTSSSSSSSSSSTPTTSTTVSQSAGNNVVSKSKSGPGKIRHNGMVHRHPGCKVYKCRYFRLSRIGRLIRMFSRANKISKYSILACTAAIELLIEEILYLAVAKIATTKRKTITNRDIFTAVQSVDLFNIHNSIIPGGGFVPHGI